MASPYGGPGYIRVMVHRDPWKWILMVVNDTSHVTPSPTMPEIGPGPRMFHAETVRITERNHEDFGAHYEWYSYDGALLIEFRARTLHDDGTKASLLAIECFCENHSSLF